MTTYGLVDTGFHAKRASDIRTSLRERWVQHLTEAGLPADIVYARDTVAGIWTSAVAVEIGEGWAGLQSVYDGTDPSAAVGVPLDNIGALRAVPRRPATYSRVTLSVTGTSGTIIPAGRLVEGGGLDGSARWRTVANVTISGSSTVEAQAEEIGAVEASIAAITTIVQPVDGWAGCSNAAIAVAGDDEETDTEYELRQRLSPRAPGGRSAGALRSVLLGLEYVDAAVVLENRGTSSATVAGKTLPAHSVIPVISPSGLTTSQEDEILTAIWDWGPAGIQVAGTGVSKTISGDGFVATGLGYDYATDLEIDVVSTVSLLSGYVLADVEGAVQAAIVAYVTALPVGGAVRLLQVLATIADVVGVAGATVTLDGSAADVTPTAVERATVGTNTVTT